MPILVTDFTWSQTDNSIHIKVPIRPVKHEKVDIFTTDSYLKANFHPFLFEVFLLHEVDNNKSKCTIKEDMIILDLNKKKCIVWDSLEQDLSKAEKMNRKKEILEKCQEKAKEDYEERRIRKSELDRFTVQQAMEIDTKQHTIMDARRDDERKKAMDALEEWRVKQNLPEIKDINQNEQSGRDADNIRSTAKIVELPSSDDESEMKKNFIKVESQKKNHGRNISRACPKKTPVKSDYIEKKQKEMTTRVLPNIREPAELNINHTPRTFPTPSRESTASEEATWIKNITLARRATGFVSEDLRPEEQDPQWCKEKGDEFFRSGNFLGAISAYTHGIKLSDKLPSLFANRSATHFALGNFNKCMNDCSTALDLMTPACEGNRRSRAKCIARRAAALARVGYLNKAIGEMKAASKLLPDDEKIKKDIYDMERAWEQNPDSD